MSGHGQDRAKHVDSGCGEVFRAPPPAVGPGRYQTEGAEHRQVAHAGQAQLHETENDDDAVEDIPALLEVVVGVKGDDLEGHLRCEDSREDLNRERVSAGPEDPGQQAPCFLTLVLPVSFSKPLGDWPGSSAQKQPAFIRSSADMRV